MTRSRSDGMAVVVRGGPCAEFGGVPSPLTAETVTRRQYTKMPFTDSVHKKFRSYHAPNRAPCSQLASVQCACVRDGRAHLRVAA